jgi:subtilase family serine protease
MGMTLAVESLEGRTLMDGYSPHQLRVAYEFGEARREYGAAAKGAGVTIAIVDAYNDPTVAHDLEVYSRHYGLARPELSVINLGPGGNTGGQSGWSVEIALDVEAIHALLPLARIDLVEAASSMIDDMAAAERYAASLPGVDVISNSWGSIDDAFSGPANVPYETAFGADPHIVYAAAAGDADGPMAFPAALPDVIAVGGTYLSRDRSDWHQRPWLSYTPGYTDPAKTTPDVRMVGGPPGMEIFGTSGFGGPTWTNAWGTSLACPAFVAIAGAADGVRIGRGDAPLGTLQVMSGLDGGTTTAPAFIAQFA